MTTKLPPVYTTDPANLAEMKARVIELLEYGWTKGVNARLANGGETYSRSPYAVCWCLLGAISRVQGPQVEFVDKISDAVESRTGKKWIANFNDDPTTTLADVLAVVRAVPTEEQPCQS